jgi:hypothetical protein
MFLACASGRRGIILQLRLYNFAELIIIKIIFYFVSLITRAVDFVK